MRFNVPSNQKQVPVHGSGREVTIPTVHRRHHLILIEAGPRCSGRGLIKRPHLDSSHPFPCIGICCSIKPVSSEPLSRNFCCRGLFSYLQDRDTRTFNSHRICTLSSLPTQRLRVASNNLWHPWQSIPTLLLPSYQTCPQVCYQHILDLLFSYYYYIMSPNCYSFVP